MSIKRFVNVKNGLEPAIHALIWIAGYMVFISVVKTLGPFRRIDGTLLWPVTIGTLVNMAIFYITSLLLIPRLTRRKWSLEFVLLLIGLLAALTLIETVIDFTFFDYYFSDYQEPMHSQLLLNSILNLIMLSLALGYGFTRNWIIQERSRRSLRQEMLTAELNFLKTQLNPHFLFNVLNMAFSSATRSRDDRTADIIEKLSGLMRYMLYDSNVERIGLDKEISYIDKYLKLQAMRLSDEVPVRVRFDVDGNPVGLRIAPLLLIPFIENAFKYGTRLGHESDINILIQLKGKMLTFTVDNPVLAVPTEASRKNSGIGLENVRKRLGLLYPDAHTLELENDGIRFRICLTINLEEQP